MDVFADFFAKSYLPSSNFHFNDLVTNNSDILNISNFMETEVLDVLKQIKSKLTTGRNNIPAQLCICHCSSHDCVC